MQATLYFPGDDKVNETLAEFLGYFWCRHLDGLVVGERIVRFLVSPQQFEQAKIDYGPTGIVLAGGNEQIEQLAFKALPPFHASRDEMAKVESKLYEKGLSTIYRAKLREVTSGTSKPFTGPLTDDEMWRLITAHPCDRARAAYVVIDSQRPKQQQLI